MGAKAAHYSGWNGDRERRKLFSARPAPSSS
jgi:hypothetical protein